jgi:hypothetical protein
MTSKILLLIGGAALVATSFTPAFARQGADDPAGRVRQARGADDAQPHN